jgi:hypothetical protein
MIGSNINASNILEKLADAYYRYQWEGKKTTRKT